ncbi:hypothetical protein I4U23_024615 [Adineta vaga]|nr:hypothetical protein I4U23_024615 [Adineta vaga]
MTNQSSSTHINYDKSSESTSSNRKGITSTLLLAVLAAVSGSSFHFGYASGVMNSPQDVIQAFINETNHRRNGNSNFNKSTITLIFSFAVSIFAVGGIIGGIFGGFITDRLGRKGGMFINNIISSIACILMFISKPLHTYELLIIGRFFIGLSCGYGSSVAPMYINEISPKHLRGTLGVIFQLGVVVFLFISQGISLYPILGSEDKWHYALGLPIVFSILQVILLFLVPESPKYLLLKKNDINQTEKALQWLRQDSNLENEIAEMRDEQNHQQKSARWIDLFQTPIVRWALFITVFLQLSQQLSGINAVFYYSTVILQSAGFNKQTAEYANLGLGGANIVVTIFSIFLMDRLGRRPLHLIGIGGMLITSVILFISLIVQSTKVWNQISLITTFLFVAFFAIGPGSIPWLITSELFNQVYRVPASSIAVLVNWLANFAVGLGFKPLFTGVLDKYTFLLFTGFFGSTDEKPMSNDAWNEMVEEIIQGKTDLLEYLLEQLINKDDIVTVRHWITQSNRPLHTLPHWMQRYIRTKPTTNSLNQNFVQNISTNFYKIPLNDSQITFVDSMPKYECLFDRLFNVNSEHQDIYIGFDCEWKPMFNNTTTSEQRISVMQIAFDDHIFLLDMFHFFRTCDSKSIQQRLADRLFDDDHVTILCYGFRADASMLTSSYPIFTQVLASGKTLLDLSLVQHDLMLIQRDIFPYVMTDNTPSKDKGLSELVRLCFGKALDKSEQCSNWERRPLRTAQIHYAATDAYCLLAIKNFLQNHLESPEYLRSFRGNHTKKSDSSQPSTKVDKTN